MSEPVGEHLPDLLTVEEVRAVLRVSRTKVYALLSEGDLRSVRVGRSVRVVRADLVAFIERGGSG
ncbi:MAG: helix-turn-helix domain-containing protein [Nitriliruptoraceae bacterium]|nr:helix-turn-helix domain-containing protein [Nitriliruptoraceae bacterium]